MLGVPGVLDQKGRRRHKVLRSSVFNESLRLENL